MEYFNKLLSKISSLRRKTISIEDISSLNELLKTGLSIKQCFVLMKTKRNEELFNNIIYELNKGIIIEEVIKKYLPKEIGNYCNPLLKTMNFSSALDLSLSFYFKTKENIKEIERSMLYPFVLLFVSLSALYLFDIYGLDSIMNMLKSFDIDLGGFKVIRIILKVVVYVFYFAMLIVIGFVYYFFQDKNISLFYIYVSKYLKDSLIHTYFCEEFVSLLLICIELGYKSKDALNILKALHNKPIVSFLAFHLDEKLLEGDSLKQSIEQDYYDSALSRFINIAVHTNDFTRLLNNYVKFSQNKIKMAMKKLTLIIELSSYSVIGVVIVFIYQVLFLPMQALGAF